MLLRQWEGVYRSLQVGVLPESVLPTVGMGGAFRAAYLNELWPRLRGFFTDDFAKFMGTRVFDADSG